MAVKAQILLTGFQLQAYSHVAVLRSSGHRSESQSLGTKCSITDAWLNSHSQTIFRLGRNAVTCSHYVWRT